MDIKLFLLTIPVRVIRATKGGRLSRRYTLYTRDGVSPADLTHSINVTVTSWCWKRERYPLHVMRVRLDRIGIRCL